jgi:membrane protein implicated in regulation of membrane protease activity
MSKKDKIVFTTFALLYGLTMLISTLTGSEASIARIIRGERWWLLYVMAAASVVVFVGGIVISVAVFVRAWRGRRRRSDETEDGGGRDE